MATTAAPLLCDTLVVAVTGSPAAVSLPSTVLLLREALVGEVRVLMSWTAQHFLPPFTIGLFAGGQVYTEPDWSTTSSGVPHVDLTADADLMLVMPATANAVAKAAHGLCDDLVSTAMVACPAPVVLVPTMNGTMWRSAVVQRNVALARDLGYHVIEPVVGVQLAAGGDDAAVMPALESVVLELEAVLDEHRQSTRQQAAGSNGAAPRRP